MGIGNSFRITLSFVQAIPSIALTEAVHIASTPSLLMASSGAQARMAPSGDGGQTCLLAFLFDGRPFEK